MKATSSVTNDKSAVTKAKKHLPTRPKLLDDRISFRCTKKQKEDLLIKATQAEKTLSGFLIECAEKTHIHVGDRTLIKQHVINLNRINANLNMLARYANVYKTDANSAEIITGLINIERKIKALNSALFNKEDS